MVFFWLLILFLVFQIPQWYFSYAQTILFTGETIVSKDKIVDKNIAKDKETFLWLPVRLKISKINIDSPIIYVGLTFDGYMDVGKGPYDVAWFKLGPQPWKEGSAVIAGHYGTWKNGAISVFNKLDTLIKGDKVTIIDDRGEITSFVVRESKIYTLDADVSDVFYSNDGKSYLNLVTCIQDKVTKEYPNRLVVFTEKE